MLSPRLPITPHAGQWILSGSCSWRLAVQPVEHFPQAVLAAPQVREDRVVLGCVVLGDGHALHLAHAAEGPVVGPDGEPVELAPCLACRRDPLGDTGEQVAYLL